MPVSTERLMSLVCRWFTTRKQVESPYKSFLFISNLLAIRFIDPAGVNYFESINKLLKHDSFPTRGSLLSYMFSLRLASVHSMASCDDYCTCAHTVQNPVSWRRCCSCLCNHPSDGGLLTVRWHHTVERLLLVICTLVNLSRVSLFSLTASYRCDHLSTAGLSTVGWRHIINKGCCNFSLFATQLWSSLDLSKTPVSWKTSCYHVRPAPAPGNVNYTYRFYPHSQWFLSKLGCFLMN